MIKFELPDIEEFLRVSNEISALSLKESNLKLSIQEKEADIIRKVSVEEKYFITNKPPSQEYIKNTYKITGFDNELLPLRQELINVSVQLESAKRNYDILKLVADIWRTQSANERNIGV